MVDVLILNYNDPATTIQLIQNISKHQAVNHILVVDNKSTDNSFQILSDRFKDSYIEVISTDRNGGYGYGNNFGLRYLKENYGSNHILVCNPDVKIDEETIILLDRSLVNNVEYLVVAPFMCDIHGNKDYHTAYRIPTKWNYILSMGVVLGRFFNRCYYKNNYLNRKGLIEVGTVAGSLFMIAIERTIDPNIYDENMFLYCEETILGLKARENGLKIGLLGNARFIHEHSTSISKSFDSELKRRKLLLKSRRYILEYYFKASPAELFLATVLERFSYFEVVIKSAFKRAFKE